MTVQTTKLPRPTAVASVNGIIGLALEYLLSIVFNAYASTISALIKRVPDRLIFPFDLNKLSWSLATITFKLDHDLSAHDI
jgi:hypothetical protein